MPTNVLLTLCALCVLSLPLVVLGYRQAKWLWDRRFAAGVEAGARSESRRLKGLYWDGDRLNTGFDSGFRRGVAKGFELGRKTAIEDLIFEFSRGYDIGASLGLRFELDYVNHSARRREIRIEREWLESGRPVQGQRAGTGTEPKQSQPPAGPPSALTPLEIWDRGFNEGATFGGALSSNFDTAKRLQAAFIRAAERDFGTPKPEAEPTKPIAGEHVNG